jgi:hypothetical protein
MGIGFAAQFPPLGEKTGFDFPGDIYIQRESGAGRRKKIKEKRKKEA